jgi:hypothetical protein
VSVDIKSSATGGDALSTQKSKYIEKENIFRRITTRNAQGSQPSTSHSQGSRLVVAIVSLVIIFSSMQRQGVKRGHLGVAWVSFKFKSVSEIESDNETTVSEALPGLPPATNPRKLNSSMYLSACLSVNQQGLFDHTLAW